MTKVEKEIYDEMIDKIKNESNVENLESMKKNILHFREEHLKHKAEIIQAEELFEGSNNISISDETYEEFESQSLAYNVSEHLIDYIDEKISERV